MNNVNFDKEKELIFNEAICKNMKGHYTSALDKVKDELDKVPLVNANAEIVDARNGKATLGEEIRGINSSLDNKANKDSVFSMANMGLDVKEAMTGGSVAVVGKDTILTENIVDKQVTYDKTNFVDLIIDNSQFTPINFFDASKLSGVGDYANPDTGAISNTSFTQSYRNTGYIACYNVDYIFGTVKSICFYDSNKVFISSLKDLSTTTTINGKTGIHIKPPSNAKYFILNVIIGTENGSSIWQVERYQNPNTNPLSIPRLDINSKIINNINGIEPVNNVVTLSAQDIGAVEQKSNTLSTVLPYTLPNSFQETTGSVVIKSDNGSDNIIIKSINEFGYNDSTKNHVLCTSSSNEIGSLVRVETNSTFGGWYGSHADIDIVGLKPNTTYTIKATVEKITGYGSGENFKGICVWEKENTNTTLKTIYEAPIINSTFTTSSTGNIKIGFYPKASAHDGSVKLIVDFKDLFIYEGTNTINFSKYYSKTTQVTGKTKINTILLPNMTIRSQNNLYNSNIDVNQLIPVGQVNSVNNIKADSNGNVSVPKTIIEGKTGVFFGDSITEFGTYPQQVGTITGLTTYNCGVGGCRMSNHPTNGYNQFSMTKIADAITTGDWTKQEQAVTELIGIGDDNSAILTRMKSIDYSKVNYIVIAFGTNDFGGGITLGDISSVKGNTTFYGSAKYVIETILTKYPQIKLYFTTPIFRWQLPGGGTNSDLSQVNGKYLKEFAKALIDVCEMYHVPVLDLYNKSNINAINQAYYISSDGTHPTTNGYALISEKVSKFLVSN